MAVPQLSTDRQYTNSSAIFEKFAHGAERGTLVIHHSRCGVDKQVLLILNNHESHISYDCLELVKHNGVTMLSLPPHCSRINCSQIDLFLDPSSVTIIGG